MTQHSNIGRQKSRTAVIRYLLLSSLICLVLTTELAFGQAQQSQFEKVTSSKASALLSAELLKSSLYTVDEEVVNDGLFNHYTVRSDYGIFEASSTLAVKQLLHEIVVIAKMKEVETTDTVKDSVVQSGKNTIDAVANLVTDPQKALEGAATGISSLFNRASQVVGKRETTDAEDNKLEQVIGKSKSKGKIATTYKVSVYSSNPALQEELERLVWADYLGGIGVGAAQSTVPGAGGLLLTASGTTRLLNEVINTTPASELWVQNKNKLVAMSIDEETVELYLNNPSFSPALQTIMVEALVSMKGVANRGLLIKISLQAHDEKMARDLTELGSMLAGYHTNVAPLKTLAPFGRSLRKVGGGYSSRNNTCRSSVMEC
ncbi:MAG: hypothetical protein QNK25_15560 [Desulfobacterales bacterium]|nr:hypothetical protein [Desulfobacterales bacterium]